MTDWFFGPDTHPFIGLLWIAILVALGLVIPQMIWLSFRTYTYIRHRRLAEQFQQQLAPRFLDVVEDPVSRADWMRETKIYPEAILREFLVPYLLTTTGSYRDQIALFYKELGFLDQDVAMLRSRLWVKRIRALRRLSVVATTDHRNLLLSFRKDQPLTRFLAAQILARVGSGDDVFLMLHDWELTRRLQEHAVMALLNTVPIPEFRRLMAKWNQFEDPVMRRILLVSASRRDPQSALPWMELASHDKNKELRIAFCAALAEMADTDSVDRLMVFLTAAEWEVRLYAVKGLGRVKDPHAIDPLAYALADDSFWVRQNAAAALTSLGEAGLNRLQHVAIHHSDRFARDAARQELARYEIIRSERGAAA